MDVRHFLPSGTALWRFGYSNWPLLVAIVASFLKAGDWPAAADLSKVEITLERTHCYGTCPEYKVTIHGDGRVVFTTETRPAADPESAYYREAAAIHQGIVLPGTHEDRIAPEAVAALLERFRKAKFFYLLPSYWGGGTDAPTYVLTLDTGRRHKSVKAYMGEPVGVPKAVTDLEDAVDRTAGTERWLRGTGLTAWLEGQHFDFHSTAAAELAASAADKRKAAEALVLALIDRGAPLDREVGNPKFPHTPPPDGSVMAKFLAESQEVPEYKTPIVAGFSLTASAIRHGRATLFNKLAAAGWPDRLGKKQTGQLFAQYAAGCSPALVDAAADAGIDIDEPDLERGRTALANLGNVSTSYLCGRQEAERLATAQRLLARGANPNHRDSVGQTPLFAVPNPDLVKLLQAHGAERR
jgi:hypothetical protein